MLDQYFHPLSHPVTLAVRRRGAVSASARGKASFAQMSSTLGSFSQTHPQTLSYYRLIAEICHFEIKQPQALPRILNPRSRLLDKVEDR